MHCDKRDKLAQLLQEKSRIFSGGFVLVNFFMTLLNENSGK